MDTATMLSNFKTRYATKYASDTINTLDMSFIKRFQESTSYTKDKDLIEFPEVDSRGNKNILYRLNNSFSGGNLGIACEIKIKDLNITVEVLNENGTAVRGGAHFRMFATKNLGWILTEDGGSIIPTVRSLGIGTYDTYSWFGDLTGQNDFVFGKYRLNVYYNSLSAPKETRFIDLLE